MKLITICLIFAFALSGCNVSFSSGDNSAPVAMTAGSPEQQAEAEAAARSYLTMIDQKEYKQTWEQAGSTLRDQSSEFAWVNTLTLTRKALDGGAQRQVEGYGFTSQIESNLPVGEYVLVQFKDVNDNVTTTEKVVMQKEQGKWKIVGYFIFKKSQFGA